MEKHIKVNKLLQCLPNDLKYKSSVKRVLAQAPAEDVVEVVRCITCKHSERVSDQFDNDWYFCKKTTDNAEVPADHYCGYGERK